MREGLFHAPHPRPTLPFPLRINHFFIHKCSRFNYSKKCHQNNLAVNC